MEKRYLIYKLDRGFVEDKDSFLLDISYNDDIDSHFYFYIEKAEKNINILKISSPEQFIRKVQENGIDLNISDNSSSLIHEFGILFRNKNVSSDITVKEFGLSKLDSNGLRNLFSLLLKASPKKINRK